MTSAPALTVAPDELVALVAGRLPGALVGFDVDGVLAPIVAHVDHSALTDGVAEALAVLAALGDVALVSGRSLVSLAGLLDFPPGLHVIGSHGLEQHGGDHIVLTTAEHDAYAALTALADRTVAAAGDGAWIERKPASLVVHTRQADGNGVAAAIGQLVADAAAVSGATVKIGHAVIELMVRTTDKGTALLDLGRRLGAASLVYLGDDRTDEDAFERMGPDDVSVRVGPGPTAARYRLADADAAADFVIGLARQVER